MKIITCKPENNNIKLIIEEGSTRIEKDISKLESIELCDDLCDSLRKMMDLAELSPSDVVDMLNDYALIPYDYVVLKI